jgi:hypothetical protein
LAPKPREIHYEDLNDCRQAAEGKLHRDSFTDDNSSGKAIISGLTVSQADSSSSMKQQALRRGDYYLRRFFGDDPSFIFLVFEELDMTTLQLPICQDTEKHVLHKDRRQHLKAYHVIAVHPEGSQYLVRDTDKHVHYGLWRVQLVMILELLQLIGKIDVVFPI